MKNFFKNRTWDDYLAMFVIGTIILGLVLFFIGFYWGFKPTYYSGLLNKVNVHNFVSKNKTDFMKLIMDGYNLPTDLNLFSLAGNIDSSFGTLYALVVLSILGFSLIILGVTMIIVVIIVGFIWDIIAKRKMKNN